MNLDPEKVHQMGLSEVAHIKKEMSGILTAEGYADDTNSIGEMMDN